MTSDNEISLTKHRSKTFKAITNEEKYGKFYTKGKK